MARRRKATDPAQLDLFESLFADLDRHAARIAEELRSSADRASKEEDIRVAVERQIALLSDRLSVRLEGKHEYTLLRGHVDSVYGSVFIEYKDPSSSAARLGPRLSSPGTQRVVAQITRRFRDVGESTGRRPSAILGVGLDGRYFVFGRCFRGRVSFEDPVEVSRWSVRRFLWSLFNLGTRGYALTPEALAEDFGSESRVGTTGVAVLTNCLLRNRENPKTSTFFDQWKILFGEVCGYDVNKPGKRVEELANHYVGGSSSPVEVLFCLHTYYALFMKLLAAHVASFFQNIAKSPIQEIRTAPSTNALLRVLADLEDGGIFRHLGVTNFLEGDLFSWYLSAWDDDLEDSIRSMAETLLDYNPGSLRDSPVQARDLLKKLYHQLFPQQLRHDLGEYYTPDWLADHTLTVSGYDGNPEVRLLDPACGSGTFIVMALARVARWLEANFETAPSPERVAELASKNIIGFDLNPLAVLAARTNYLIQFYDLFDYKGALEIPIYLSDSVLMPTEYGDSWQEEIAEKPIEVPTCAKQFLVPRDVARDRATLGSYCNLLAEYARATSGFEPDNFIDRCRDEGLPVSEADEVHHRRLFADIRELDVDRRNGIWARFIKNAFAPVFIKADPVDFVIGNPPWVGWESLPGSMESDAPNYRKQIARVFQDYGLFTLSGTAGRMGGGKKDLSMIFLYASPRSSITREVT